ncbi:HupE/UreJ family protein [Algiphilus aromaticivorans]|uniref:HupE/UreJ family protein n=1 Tax=Algiphilus aromaticivorans TaxID=382454 RepID=UPI000693C83E|nr:HupE/UreJ family protein [Algiphilus aromaticivorans]
MTRLFSTLALLVTLGLPGLAGAHALAPSVLTLSAEGDGRLIAGWRYSLRDPGAAELRPVFPPACEHLQGPASTPAEAGFAAQRWRLDCSAAKPEAQLRIAGLADGPRSVLLRREGQAGVISTQLLDGGRVTAPLWPVGSVPWSETARDYMGMGVEHLLLGPDHLLFVVGLFLLVARLRQLLALTLGFTLGHSLTLAASVLGYLQLPQAVAEWGIAASIVWLGWRVLRAGPAQQSGTLWLTVAASGFGLLHGLGFAGALADIGLPESQLWLALAAFNIGIELGQVAVVVALTGLAWVLRALARAPSIRHAHTTAAYAMGTMGAFWCIDRGALLLPPVW